MTVFQITYHKPGKTPRYYELFATYDLAKANLDFSKKALKQFHRIMGSKMYKAKYLKIIEVPVGSSDVSEVYAKELAKYKSRKAYSA